MTLTGDDTRGQRGPRSDVNKGVLRVAQSTIISGTSSSDGLVSYKGHSLAESYPFAEMPSVYSTAQTGWENLFLFLRRFSHQH